MQQLFVFLLITCAAAPGQGLTGRSMKAQPMPALEEMLKYRLTANKLEKYIQASNNVTALVKKDPTIGQRMKGDRSTAPKTLDQSVAYAKEKFPDYYAAVEKGGISYREYTLFEGSLIAAWVASTRPRPNSKVEILPENLKFVRDNHDKIAALLSAKRAG